jgi:hypothetical protein
MCGGLVTASCDKNKDIVKYQLGRLIGYLFLGFFAGYLGSLIKFQNKSPLVTILPGLIIGLLFLYWGIESLKGKKAELPMPKFMGKFYSFLWKKLVYKNISFSKSFFTGLISIFLPCGLLYGIVLSGLALQHPIIALLSMFFFWLGTVPSMLIAPKIITKILNPLKSKLPITYAVSLILMGVITISLRLQNFNELRLKKVNGTSSQMSCH